MQSISARNQTWKNLFQVIPQMFQVCNPQLSSQFESVSNSSVFVELSQIQIKYRVLDEQTDGSLTLINQATVQQLRIKIAETLSRDRSEVVLKLRDTQLMNPTTLTSLLIEDGDIIQVTFALSRLESELTIKIYQRQLKISINNQSTVRALKVKIKSISHIRVRDQRLVLNDTQLENNKRISDYRDMFVRGARLVLLERSRGGLKIKITTLEASFFHFDFESSTKVGEIKVELQRMRSISLLKIRLMYGDRQLLDDYSLEDYKIGNDDIILFQKIPEGQIQVELVLVYQIFRVSINDNNYSSQLQNTFKKMYPFKIDRQLVFLLNNQSIINSYRDRTLRQARVKAGSRIFIHQRVYPRSVFVTSGDRILELAYIEGENNKTTYHQIKKSIEGKWEIAYSTIVLKVGDIIINCPDNILAQQEQVYSVVQEDRLYVTLTRGNTSKRIPIRNKTVEELENFVKKIFPSLACQGFMLVLDCKIMQRNSLISQYDMTTNSQIKVLGKSEGVELFNYNKFLMSNQITPEKVGKDYRLNCQQTNLNCPGLTEAECIIVEAIPNLFQLINAQLHAGKVEKYMPYLLSLQEIYRKLQYFDGLVYRELLTDTQNIMQYIQGKFVCWPEMWVGVQKLFSNPSTKTLFKLHLQSARRIRHQKGWLVLCMPYMYFKVVETNKMESGLSVIELVETPVFRANTRILWVDDQPHVNRKICYEIQNKYKQPVLLARSTAQAIFALEQLNKMSGSEEINKIRIITDMRRQQPTGMNSQAGADLIRYVRVEKKYTNEILVYCEDTVSALEQCRQNGINPQTNHFTITNLEKDVLRFSQPPPIQEQGNFFTRWWSRL